MYVPEPIIGWLSAENNKKNNNIYYAQHYCRLRLFFLGACNFGKNLKISLMSKILIPGEIVVVKHVMDYDYSAQ